MPEGDTIHRTASTLRRVLAGKTLAGARSSLPALRGAELVGSRVAAVESHGKNLLIHLDDGRTIYSHMKLVGSWHIYRRGEHWQKPERLSRLVLETDDFVAVCFNAPVVELLEPGGAQRHEMLRRLGPDVAAESFDAAAARARLERLGRRAIGEALLTQSALAGLGNVYKSETLFLCGIHPFAPVEGLPAAVLDRIVATARALLRRNLGGCPRSTRSADRGGRLWVYRRAGRPCLRCGEHIVQRRQGAAGRSTYWCPRCQSDEGSPSPARRRTT